MSFAAVLARSLVLQNPYPGLRQFDTKEAHLFFGRDLQIAELVDRLARLRFVAVVGLSGSGKSSLVRAGLIPALRAGSIFEANARWRIIVTRPAGAPFESLSNDIRDQGLDPSRLRESSYCLSSVAEQLDGDESLLLVVDQFEELFRYKEREATARNNGVDHEAASEAAEFVDMLLTAARHHPPIYIVLTMRSDYLGDCAAFRDFPEALNQSQYLVPRLTREQRKESIEGPLGRVEIAPALLQTILNDAGDEPDQLPILQHALMRTWEQARKRWDASTVEEPRRIEIQDYKRAGGFESALNDHADELLVTTNPSIAEQVFRRLTKRAADHRERRDPARLQDLWNVCGATSPSARQEVCSVVNRFREGTATFLLPSAAQAPAIEPDDYIDITHESLIRQWTKMREWMAKESAASTRYLDILDDALLHEKGEASLLVDPQLAMALAQWEADKPTAAWAARYSRGWGKGDDEFNLARRFLENSRFDRDESKRREDRRRKTRLATLLIFTVIAVLAAAYAFYMGQNERQEHLNSLSGKLLAESLAVQSKTPSDLRRSVLLAAESISYQPAGQSIAMNLYAMEQGLSLLPHLLKSVGTEGPVLTVGITDDGKFAAFGSWDGTIRVLKRTGNEPAEIWKDKQSGAIWCSTFSKDGRFLATGSDDGVIRVYQVDTPSPHVVKQFKHMAAIWKIAFSVDGRKLASASQDNTATVYDLSSSLPPVQLRHAGQVEAICFSHDGKYVATGGQDRLLRVFRSDGNLLWPRGARQEKQAGAIFSIAFSPDDQQLATGGDDKTVRLYSALNGKQNGHWSHSRAVRAVAFSNNGKFLASGSDDATARVFDVETGAEVSRLIHRGAVNAIAFSANGHYIATGSQDKTARLFDALSGTEVLRQSHKEAVLAVALSANGKYLVTGSMDKSASLWDTSDPGEVAAAPLKRGETIAQMAVPYNGEYVATIAPTGETHVVNLTTNVSITVAPPPLKSASYNQIGVSENADFVVIGGGEGWAVLNRESQRWTSVQEDHALKALDMSPNGKLLVTSNVDGLISLIDIQTSQVLWRHQVDRPSSITLFSPSGKSIALAGEEDKIRILDSATGLEAAAMDNTFDLKTCQERKWQTCSVTSLSFSTDDQFLATGSSDRTARLYDLRTHKLTRRFAHDADVISVVLSADHKYLGSDTDDLAGHIFDTATGNQISSLVLQNSDFFPLSFSSDDRFVLTGSDLGSLRITRHLWRKEDLLQETCRRVGTSIDLTDWKAYDNDEPRKICAVK